MNRVTGSSAGSLFLCPLILKSVYFLNYSKCLSFLPKRFLHNAAIFLWVAATSFLSLSKTNKRLFTFPTASPLQGQLTHKNFGLKAHFLFVLVYFVFIYTSGGGKFEKYSAVLKIDLCMSMLLGIVTVVNQQVPFLPSLQLNCILRGISSNS